MSQEQSIPLPRVLVVDDSRMVRASIVKRIKESFDVREEGDGEAGWQTLVLDPDIQIVISDLSMPKLDGYGLLQRIRSSKIARLRDIPVIMISGDEDDHARQRAKECGATDFITKGTGTVELLARLDALIKLARTSRQLEESRQTLAQTAAVDPESGLYTRGYQERQGEQTLSHARRHHAEVTALAIGLDRLEPLLHEHGEALGEKLAAQFAKMLRASVRKEDTLARVGPCDFTIVSPSTSYSASRAFADRLRDSIRRAAIQYGGRTLHLTVSVGIANNLTDNVESADALIARAEERMECAREAGGDQIGECPSGVAAPPGIERALLLLKSGQTEAVLPHLGPLTKTLLPLLRLMQQQYGLDWPVHELERRLEASPENIQG